MDQLYFYTNEDVYIGNQLTTNIINIKYNLQLQKLKYLDVKPANHVQDFID